MLEIKSVASHPRVDLKEGEGGGQAANDIKIFYCQAYRTKRKCRRHGEILV
jgi:hypothetical protein